MEDGKECSSGGCNSNAKVISFSDLLGAKAEDLPQENNCGGCGGCKTKI